MLQKRLNHHFTLLTETKTMFRHVIRCTELRIFNQTQSSKDLINFILLGCGSLSLYCHSWNVMKMFTLQPNNLTFKNKKKIHLHSIRLAALHHIFAGNILSWTTEKVPSANMWPVFFSYSANFLRGNEYIFSPVES